MTLIGNTELKLMVRPFKKGTGFAVSNLNLLSVNQQSQINIGSQCQTP